jgi:RNA polymerase sigma-70 factor (sigma-E family)
VVVMMVAVEVGQQAAGDAAPVLAELHRLHYRSLVRLAGLLLDDLGASEDAVQEAFVRVWRSRGRISDPAKALSYLRTAVLNEARSRLRRRRVAARHPLGAPGLAASAEVEALARHGDQEVVVALRRLPARQQDCVLLRFYLDLSAAQTAETLQISPGAVKTHVHRAMVTLTRALKETT